MTAIWRIHLSFLRDFEHTRYSGGLSAFLFSSDLLSLQMDVFGVASCSLIILFSHRHNRLLMTLCTGGLLSTRVWTAMKGTYIGTFAQELDVFAPC